MRPQVTSTAPVACGRTSTSRVGGRRRPVKAYAQTLQSIRTKELKARLAEAGKAVGTLEKKRFDRRRREPETAVGENQIDKLIKEIDKLRTKAMQLSVSATSIKPGPPELQLQPPPHDAPARRRCPRAASSTGRR